MTYPTEEQLLRADPLLPWLDEHFFRPDPYAFAQHGFWAIVTEVAKGFDIDANGVYCIGSGALGLSLNPFKVERNALKSYDSGSDIDLAVISELHFETAWRDLRRASQPTASNVPAELRQTVQWQKKRFFDGAIIANEMLPFISFGPAWISATIRIQTAIADALGREAEVNMWLYRDYWSVRNYVASGVTQCRQRLQLEGNDD